ncbi:A-kinase anchor protein 10, mitochondrial [Topomyia yanbarensis]|uniref:A-kinase anchor protein 10, mitochondrial n=1 Tax=Topomyia yanbarensis TaxID=2498891 RepID=UPI00273AEDD7|nr:A-kinase anchor protein 10, mitochondrial [Topomyia yanbarensis]
MLQFLKKSAAVRKKSGSGSISSHEDGIGGKTGDAVVITACHQQVASDEEVLAEAEQFWMDQHLDTAEIRSRLSRNLLDILTEQSCFCYFVQFLETKDALPLIKFWLDVESFKAAAAEGLKWENRNGICSKIVNHRPLDRSVSTDGYDSLSFRSVDCDSISTFSENVFEEGTGTSTVTITDPDSDPSCRTSGACTPTPVPLEVVVEEDRKPESAFQEDDDRKRILEVRDLTLRQSLTDDEKTHIFEANKLKLEEPKKSMNGYNSLIDSDAVRIYRKYLVSNSPYYIEVPATVMSSISLALCGGACSERIFETAQQYLLEVLDKSYLNAFLDSGFYLKYTFEVLSSNNVDLRDILCSEMALFYFMEYLEQEGKRHILEFCVTASHFRKSTEGNQTQADALVLYEKYFSLQATCPLNLSDKVRFLIEEQICSQDITTIKNCFELSSRIIERFLEKRYFQGFLKSPLYTNYLSELLGRIKMTASGETIGGSLGILAGPKQIFSDRTKTPGHKRGHRKTFSDVTNNSTNRPNHSSFISSQNTLLAMSDASFHRKRTTPLGSTTASTGSDMMQIDSRQLYNPDLLWKRNSTAGLTFGRVDALGRYERDFDIAEPPQDEDRWSKNRFKKAMRKLVNLPEDKAQEELAWQVAEMIVNDITSITMNHGVDDVHKT